MYTKPMQPSSINQRYVSPPQLLDNYDDTLLQQQQQQAVRPHQPRNTLPKLSSTPNEHPSFSEKQPQHFSFVQGNENTSHQGGDYQSANQHESHMVDSEVGATQQQEIFSIEYMETLLNLLQSSPLLSSMQFSSEQLTLLLSSEDFQLILSEHFSHNGGSLSPLEMANLLLSMLTSSNGMTNEDEEGHSQQQMASHRSESPITCSKCGEVPDNYLELNCSHAFCLDCMAFHFIERGLIDDDLPSSEIDIDCLICGTTITIDTDSVEAVANTINTIRINFQQAHQQQQPITPHVLLPQEIIYEDSGETFQTEETTRHNNKPDDQQFPDGIQNTKVSPIPAQQQLSASSSSRLPIDLYSQKQSSSTHHLNTHLQITPQSAFPQVAKQQNIHTLSSPTLQSDRTRAPSQTTSALQRSSQSTPSQSFSAEKQQQPPLMAAAYDQHTQQQQQLEGVKEQVMEDDEDEQVHVLSSSSSSAFDPRHLPSLFSRNSSHSKTANHSTNTNNNCLDHPSEKLNFFNHTRNRFMCLRCVQQGNSATDEISSIEKALTSFPKQLQHALEQSTVTADIVALAESQAQADQDQLSSILNDQRNTIFENINNVLESLQNKKQTLITQSEALHNSAKAKLLNEKQVLIEAIQNLDALAPHFDNINQTQITPSPHIYRIFAASTEVLTTFLHHHKQFLTVPTNMGASTLPADEINENYNGESSFAQSIQQLQFRISDLDTLGKKTSLKSSKISQKQQSQQQTPSPNECGYPMFQQYPQPTLQASSSTKPYYKSSVNTNNIRGPPTAGFPFVAPNFDRREQSPEQQYQQKSKGTLLWSDDDETQHIEQSMQDHCFPTNSIFSRGILITSPDRNTSTLQKSSSHQNLNTSSNVNKTYQAANSSLFTNQYNQFEKQRTDPGIGTGNKHYKNLFTASTFTSGGDIINSSFSRITSGNYYKQPIMLTVTDRTQNIVNQREIDEKFARIQQHSGLSTRLNNRGSEYNTGIATVNFKQAFERTADRSRFSGLDNNRRTFSNENKKKLSVPLFSHRVNSVTIEDPIVAHSYRQHQRELEGERFKVSNLSKKRNSIFVDKGSSSKSVFESGRNSGNVSLKGSAMKASDELNRYNCTSNLPSGNQAFGYSSLKKYEDLYNRKKKSLFD